MGLLESDGILCSDMSQASGDAILHQCLHQLKQRTPRLILRLKLTGDYQRARRQASEMLSQARLVASRRLFVINSSLLTQLFKVPFKSPQAQAAELKEKLLRDKIKKMRKTSIESREKSSC